MSSGGTAADLLLAHNVLQHVPDINDFIEGMRILLKPDGVMTLQFHYLLSLMEHSEFDTIYHEHFSYLSFMTVQKILAAHGLFAFDVMELSAHGGSIRIFACHAENEKYKESPRVAEQLQKERARGLDKIETYENFSAKADRVKRDLLSCLIRLKNEGKKIAAYGAAAKGNTLLNYCGIRTDFIDYAVDMSPHKQGTLLPGSRIKVLSPDSLEETKPDYIMILPWNLKDEITKQLEYTKKWGARFIIPVPEVTILP